MSCTLPFLQIKVEPCVQHAACLHDVNAALPLFPSCITGSLCFVLELTGCLFVFKCRLIQDSFAAAVVGAGCRLRLRTQLRHKYLRALDVDIAVSLGGTGDQRILISNIKCLTDSLAMMVVDSRGKICYATTPLATMLGHTVRNLSKMSFQGLIPPPHAQLHKHWMKVMTVLA